ncbi:MAG: hypothetical protein JWP81_4874 [Ferruginibacter sp.]|nr:hypothetical protein [Ferruginibacter sp.]
MGSEYSLPRRTEDLAFLGNEKDGIVNLSLKKEELNIIRFDPKTLNQTAEKVIELEEATKNFNSERVVDINNNYFWLHSDWDKEAEKELLYYDKIDVQTGKITVANHKMLEASKIAGSGGTMTGFYRFKATNKYDYNFDADQKKLLVSYRLTPELRNDKKNYDKIGLYVFDENINKMWGNEFTMPYTEAIMDNSDFSVDSKGNAYLLTKVYDSDSRKERDKSTGAPAYHYEVLKFTKDSKKIIIATIDIGDYFIRETSLIENSLHEMIVACTYSKKSRGTGTDGIFLALLDQNGKIAKYRNGYYEFPLAELEKFESARSQRKMEKKDDYEVPNLKVRNVLIEGDGSVFIACEEYHLVSHYYTTGSGFSTVTYTSYYEDMLGAKINAAGKFEWLRKIPKRQIGGLGTGTMSFKLISDASGYYFLYLDNLKNMELSDSDVPKIHRDGYGGQVIVSKLDNNGVLSKDLLFDTREEDIMIYPSDFNRINGNQFIGRARLKKNLFKPLLITVN